MIKLVGGRSNLLVEKDKQDGGYGDNALRFAFKYRNSPLDTISKLLEKGGRKAIVVEENYK